MRIAVTLSRVCGPLPLATASPSDHTRLLLGIWQQEEERERKNEKSERKDPFLSLVYSTSIDEP